MWILARALLVAAFSWYVWRGIGSQLSFPLAFLLGTAAATAGSLLLGIITKQDLDFMLNLRKRVVPQAEIHEQT